MEGVSYQKDNSEKMKIILATKNKGKVADFEKLTENMNIEVISFLDEEINFPDVVEDGNTFEENSVKKALEIAKYTGMITVSDDSGLCVEALDGAPGIYSARYSGENATDSTNIDKLLDEMKNIPQGERQAKFVSVVSIAKPDGTVQSFRGEVEGEIIFERKGTNGFGYNPVFFSYELEKTFGEATMEERVTVSHRARAFRKLKEQVLNKFI